jgi:hypothetical protein
MRGFLLLFVVKGQRKKKYIYINKFIVSIHYFTNTLFSSTSENFKI